MTAAVPAAEARALPSTTPRPIAPIAPPAPSPSARRTASPSTDARGDALQGALRPERLSNPARLPEPELDLAPAPRSHAEQPLTTPSSAASSESSRADATEGSAVVRNAAGRAIDPAVAERLRADPLVRHVTDILDAPVQRVVPRRGRPSPTSDEGE